MSPETDANDHVPLEFLLGARAKSYFRDSSNTSVHERSSKTSKRIFAASIHSRRREEEARELLRRVLEPENPVFREDLLLDDGLNASAMTEIQSDRSAVLKALVDTSVLDEESSSDSEQCPVRIKTLQHMREDDLQLQLQRDNSFHGYQNQNSFLNVNGAAARIPHTTTRQLRDLAKAKKKFEAERKQYLVKIVQEQKVYTRTALQHHQEFSKAQQQKHPRTVTTQVLALDSIENQAGHSEQNTKSLLALPLLNSYNKQKLFEEQQRSHKPVLATLNFDTRELSTMESDIYTLDDSRSPHSFKDLLPNSDADNSSELVRRRLGDRQRGVFVSTAANGLFLGGGFISKKTTYKHDKRHESSNNSSNRFTQAASEREFLEAVLGAQSASILSLAEANKPALRRVEARVNRSKHHHKPHPDKE